MAAPSLLARAAPARVNRAVNFTACQLCPGGPSREQLPAAGGKLKDLPRTTGCKLDPHSAILDGLFYKLFAAEVARTAASAQSSAICGQTEVRR